MLSVFVCGVATYCGVFMSHVQILTMVNSGLLNPLETGLMWSMRLQYGGLILGVFLLGLALAIGLGRSQSPPRLSLHRRYSNHHLPKSPPLESPDPQSPEAPPPPKSPPSDPRLPVAPRR